MVNFSLFTKVTCLKKSRRSVYNLKKADLSGLKSVLRYLPWDTVFVDNDIDASTACWYDLFLSCVDEFVPKVLIRDANRPPWRSGVRNSGLMLAHWTWAQAVQVQALTRVIALSSWLRQSQCHSQSHLGCSKAD